MSGAKLRQEAKRWYRQAEDDMEAASGLLLIEKYAQACFYAQQAAEKALKAVGFFLDLDPWGHSCTRLIQNFPDEEQQFFSDVVGKAKALDKLYIPTRYPDALAEITPAEAFTKPEAKAAILSAREIINYVEKRIHGVAIELEDQRFEDGQ